MSWFTEALTSEFFWGIVVGLLLSTVVAYITIHLERREKRRIVYELCKDLITSICDLIQNLEDNRQRNKIIDYEFLDTITEEIIVCGRNREDLVLIPGLARRSEFREFFTRVAALVAQIRWHIRQFNDAYGQAQIEPENPSQENEAYKDYNWHLNEAHKACDLLRDMKNFGARIA